MNAPSVRQSYGKSQVRLSRIERLDSHHEFLEVAVDVALQGGFDAAYVEGNNQSVIPTDTIKNTVYAITKKTGDGSGDGLARALASHFLTEFDHVEHVDINVTERLWDRIQHGGKPHPHAFVGGGSEHKTCHVNADRSRISMRCGFRGLKVLKTTDSGFSGFNRDPYTTLQDTEDRIFATTISASWPCLDLTEDWSAAHRTIRPVILDVFASNFSPSVQKTLYEMAEAVFAKCAVIDEISIEMPNQHHLLANLKPLGFENPNEIFVPTAEPFGMIAATVYRNAK